MKNMFKLLLVATFLSVASIPSVRDTAVYAEDKKAEQSIPAFLQDISVTISANRSEGSGVAFTRDGITFIWTAAHVVSGLRSTRGQLGSNSMTAGIVSQHGRVLSGLNGVFDQTTVTAFPGSSGGGVYLEDGRYIGMLVRGAGEGFNLIVPVRRMRTWAKEANVEWAMDPTAKMPTPEELSKLPVEFTGTKFSANAGTDADKKKANKSFPRQIRTRSIFPFSPESASKRKPLLVEPR